MDKAVPAGNHNVLKDLQDAVRKRGINLAADQLRLALSRDEGDPLERLLIERIACN